LVEETSGECPSLSGKVCPTLRPFHFNRLHFVKSNIHAKSTVVHCYMRMNSTAIDSIQQIYRNAQLLSSVSFSHRARNSREYNLLLLLFGIQ